MMGSREEDGKRDEGRDVRHLTCPGPEAGGFCHTFPFKDRILLLFLLRATGALVPVGRLRQADRKAI